MGDTLFEMPLTAVTSLRSTSGTEELSSVTHRDVTIEVADALSCYDAWPRPTAIVVDGPYGVGGFPGDPPTPNGLADWYAPHAAEWARHALPETTLWFWGTELSWATVHPTLLVNGWDYRCAHVWDKGIGHIAGNVNGDTIRGFPVVSEICVQYTRRVELRSGDGELLPMMQWLRCEWQRTGLPLYKTNEACGVKNAATRKYFTQDHLWYFPPPEMMERLARFAAQRGRPTGRPYFSLDGATSLTAEQWSRMRAKWHHVHGITNVWSEPPVRGTERIKAGGVKPVHGNQKPLRLMDLMIRACTDPGDVVWEPFGGLCSAAVAALRCGRRCVAAEVDAQMFLLAAQRLKWEAGESSPSGDDDSAAAA